VATRFLILLKGNTKFIKFMVKVTILSYEWPLRNPRCKLLKMLCYLKVCKNMPTDYAITITSHTCKGVGSVIVWFVFITSRRVCSFHVRVYHL